jgi:hypothetical protein
MGPVASVISRFSNDSKLRQMTLDVIHSRANEVLELDFWIVKRPFSVSFQPDIQELDNYRILEPRLGWRPESIIYLIAGCNQFEDHRILGELSLAIAHTVQGVVGFSGSMHDYTKDSTILLAADLFVCPDDGESILGPSVLAAWLRHTDFRMVK